MTLRTAAAILSLLLLAAAAPAQPKFAVEGGKLFDFGELRTIAPVTRELRITNAGTDTLRISNVSGSCGCTGTLLSDSDIPPGGDGILKITFDPAKFTGKVEKVVSMKTNDPADGNPHITFTATVTQILEFGVTHIVVTTAVDSEATALVDIRNVSKTPIRVTGIRAVPGDLIAAMSRETLQPGESAELRCSARPGKAGIIKGDITLTTDNPLLPEIGLRYFIYAKAPAGKPVQSSGK